MKVIIIFALVAWSQAAKLDKAYLPPSARAQSSGGSPNFLQTPLSGSSAPTAFGVAGNGFPDDFAPTGNDFAPSGNGFAPSGNGFADNGNTGNGYAQPGNGYAQSGNVYAQNGFAQSGNRYAQSGNGYSNSGNGYKSFELKPERAQAAFERNAAILRQSSENDVDSFAYAFETENGIRAEENGVATHGVEAQGGFSYTGDDGKVYSVRYTADQNGFVPQGDHLPTPPPIPEEILKALEQNAREEAAGIYDDGSYKEANYADGNGYPSHGNYNTQNGNDEDTIVTNNALLRNAQGTQGSGFGNQVENSYLPPFAGNSGQNAFERRSTFNARDGYRY